MSMRIGALGASRIAELAIVERDGAKIDLAPPWRRVTRRGPSCSPKSTAWNARWSLELAGDALMDLGCYGLQLMRRLGHPSIVRAHAEQRSPGVDAWCDVELAFPGGATGLSANSMVADDYTFTLTYAGIVPSGRRMCDAKSQARVSRSSKLAGSATPKRRQFSRAPTNERRSIMW